MALTEKQRRALEKGRAIMRINQRERQRKAIERIRSRK